MVASVLITVDTQILIMVSTLIIPIIHGIIGKSTASDKSKALLTVILTGIAGLISAVIADEGAFTENLLLTWGATFVTTIATYYGLYKPFNLANSEGELQKLTKGRGVAPLG